MLWMAYPLKRIDIVIVRFLVALIKYNSSLTIGLILKDGSGEMLSTLITL